MTPNFKVDDRILMEGLRALERDAGLASVEAAQAYATKFGETMLPRWPRDTNRSARGFEVALNQAGCGPFPESPIVRSRIAEKLAKKLQRNYAFWRRRVVAQETQARERGVDPTRWASHRRALRRLEKAQKDIEAFAASQGEALVLGLKQELGDRQIGVRTRVYGGTGQVVTDGERAVVILVNHEPHARFLERRLRIVQHALAETAVTARREVLKRLTARAPASWKRGAA